MTKNGGKIIQLSQEVLCLFADPCGLRMCFCHTESAEKYIVSEKDNVYCGVKINCCFSAILVSNVTFSVNQ